MNSEALTIWMQSMREAHLPQHLIDGAEDASHALRQQWGDKARRRAEDRYRATKPMTIKTDVILNVEGVKGGGRAAVRCTFDYEDRTFLHAYSWHHSHTHGFELILQSQKPYSFYPASNAFEFHGVWCADDESHGYDTEHYLTVADVLKSAASGEERNAILAELVKRHINSELQHYWIAAAPNVHRCLFCHTLRAKKPSIKAYYRVDDCCRVTSHGSKKPICKPVRPARGSYTAEQMDMALRIASDDNFTISSLK